MHVVYCLQLERFLCRECGMVKCDCKTPSAVPNPLVPDAPSQSADETNTQQTHNHEPLTKSDSIEYRNPKPFTRQLSGPENSEHFKKPPIAMSRASESPFVRSPQGENGKLRRSFAVRSREGLENLLSFASVRKGHDQGKNKQIPKQWYFIARTLYL